MVLEPVGEGHADALHRRRLDRRAGARVEDHDAFLGQHAVIQRAVDVDGEVAVHVLRAHAGAAAGARTRPRSRPPRRPAAGWPDDRPPPAGRRPAGDPGTPRRASVARRPRCTLWSSYATPCTRTAVISSASGRSSSTPKIPERSTTQVRDVAQVGALGTQDHAGAGRRRDARRELLDGDDGGARARREAVGQRAAGRRPLEGVGQLVHVDLQETGRGARLELDALPHQEPDEACLALDPLDRGEGQRHVGRQRGQRALQADPELPRVLHGLAQDDLDRLAVLAARPGPDAVALHVERHRVGRHHQREPLERGAQDGQVGDELAAEHAPVDADVVALVGEHQRPRRGVPRRPAGSTRSRCG